MKKHIIFGIFVLCLLNGCVVEPASNTKIEIVNKSSYDLHVSFYPYDPCIQSGGIQARYYLAKH